MTRGTLLFHPADPKLELDPLKRVDVVLNPASGGGAGRKLKDQIVRELQRRGVGAEVHETTGPGSARDIAFRLSSSGEELVVAAGGDGTIHEVANGLLEAGTSCALGLIPAGTGNDFVKVVPGTRDRNDAFDTIARGRMRRYDVGRVRWDNQAEYFVNGMGTGIDVEVVRQLKRLPQLPGPVKYLLALFRALFHFRPIDLRVEMDGQSLGRRMMIVAVGNGVCQGGGFYLAPNARPDDGLLDVCVVDALSLPAIARVLPRIMRGTQAGDPAVLMRAARRVVFEALDGRPLFFHLDGELREPPGLRTLEIDVMPAALPVLAASEET